jgi:hypothetical protein
MPPPSPNPGTSQLLLSLIQERGTALPGCFQIVPILASAQISRRIRRSRNLRIALGPASAPAGREPAGFGARSGRPLQRVAIGRFLLSRLRLLSGTGIRIRQFGDGFLNASFDKLFQQLDFAQHALDFWTELHDFF